MFYKLPIIWSSCSMTWQMWTPIFITALQLSLSLSRAAFSLGVHCHFASEWKIYCKHCFVIAESILSKACFNLQKKVFSNFCNSIYFLLINYYYIALLYMTTCPVPSVHLKSTEFLRRANNIYSLIYIYYINYLL